MWNELSAAERERVGEIGPGYYAEFGDAVAKRRQIVEMRHFTNQRTGSHVGWNGNIAEVAVPFSAQLDHIDTSVPLAMYADERADPERYWRIQDAILAGGTVEAVQPAETGGGA